MKLRSNVEQARRILEEARRQYPENVSVLFAQGYLHSSEEEYTRAIDAFAKAEEAAAADPRRNLAADFFLQYGAACERAGLNERAAEIFERGLEKYPDAHEMMNYLAYMWAEQGKNLEEALDRSRRSLEHEPANPAYLDTLGWILHKQGKHTQALAHLQKAHEMLPEDPVIAEHLGDVLAAMGRMEAAHEYWKTSLRLNPGRDSVIEKLERAGGDVEVQRPASAPEQ